MKCLACDVILTDRQASRKYENWRDLPEGEGRYIMLCDHCIQYTDLTFSENPLADNEEYSDDYQSDAETDHSV